MTIDVLRILNSSPHTSGGKVVREKMEALQKAAEQLNKPGQPLHATGSELQASGQGAEYSRLQGNLTRIEGYKVNSSSSKERLNREHAFLEQVRTLVTKFSTNDIEGSDTSVGKTRADYANEALADFKIILNTNIDGEYFFGGANNKVPPVAADLTAQSNLINGVPTANYTAFLVPSLKEVPISDLTTIETGIHAGEKCFQSLIGYLNLAKNINNGSTQAARAAADAMMHSGLEQLGQLHEKVLSSLKRIDDAEVYNDNLRVSTHQTLQEDFSVPADVAAENLSDAIMGLEIEYILQQKMHESAKRLSQIVAGV